jgi:hypothetical protein
MYPLQLDRITRPALLHWELFSGRCEFLLEKAHPSDVATGPITARDEDELGDVSLYSDRLISAHSPRHRGSLM